MDDNVDRKTKENDKIYKIIFEKKNTRTNIRIGINLGIIVIIALIVLSVFLNFIIKYKYGDVIEEVKNTKFNKNNMIISDYTSVVKKVSKSLVTITEDNGEANSVTGVVITERGVILTNYSGIKDMEHLNVIFNNDEEESVEGKLLLKDEEFDLALIEVDYEGNIQAIKLADEDSIVEGQGIAVLGSVYSEGQKIESIIPGIIVARYNKSGKYDTLVEECTLLQISAPINLNNTGGPICNSNGELIGIGSLYLTEKFGLEGVYYGIELKNLDNIINSTSIIKEVLGITEGGILMDIEHHKHGFYVGQLKKVGNAYKSGIKPTDIIVSIEGVNISNINGITEMLNSKNKGDTISCEVLSDGIIKEVEIKIYDQYIKGYLVIYAKYPFIKFIIIL